MARQVPDGLLGIHASFAQMATPGVLGHIRNGDPPPADLSDAEKRAYQQMAFATYTADTASSRAPARRRSAAAWPTCPSAWPPGSWTTTPPPTSTSPGSSPDTPTARSPRDDWLDNTTLYWLTNTAASAARLYWQQAVTGTNFYAAADVSLPAAVTVFPEEYVTAPRSWTEKAYHNLIYFHQAERGGHFAAWEQPQLFAEELRAAFGTLR